jgi:hypothetical protein
MGSGMQPILRTPLILLAMANLMLLGTRLWPWQDVMNLPGNGTVGIDPAVCLAAYIGIIFLIASTRQEPTRQALGSGTLLGLLGGMILAGEVLLKAQAANQGSIPPVLWTRGLLAAAVLLWGIAGWRAARVTGNNFLGMLTGTWSAMVSCLMASTAVLAEMYLAGPPPVSQDPWKQYEGLAIGDPATQALVHSLNSTTSFLVIGPLAGAAIGFLLSSIGQNRKS